MAGFGLVPAARVTEVASLGRWRKAPNRSFDQGVEADRLEKAVETVLADGLRTADLLGQEGVAPVSTSQMGDAIIAALDASL
jgi:3-isopropylmalate dehydrogenase